jgi:hypothetical protein
MLDIGADLVLIEDAVFDKDLAVEQLRMRASTNKYHAIALQEIDQEQIAFDVALTMVSPLANEFVVQPFLRQRPIVGYKQLHRLLQAIHVMAP